MFYLTKRLKHECSLLGITDIPSPLYSLGLHEQISSLSDSLNNLLQRKVEFDFLSSFLEYNYSPNRES